MRATSAVVLVIDRLGAGWLGPYGNTWIETPNFNRLAARSLLCETVLAESPDLAASCRSYWTGCHVLAPDGAASAGLPDLAAGVGATSLLLTDAARVLDHPLAARFADRRRVPTSAVSSSAESVEQTGLFAFFDAARSALQEQTRPHLVWLHSRGMSGPWDAPLALRYQFADEEDPEPPHFVEPPQQLLKEHFDPDEALGFVHAYAGQVALVDMCLGMLLDALDESAKDGLSDETLLIVTSPRGYPLGEHRRVGACDEALYAELLQTPLLIRFPGDEHAVTRSQAIVQLREIHSLIAESCGWAKGGDDVASRVLSELRGEAMPSPGVAVAVGPGQRAIRTPAWYLREAQTADGLRHELFAKPDDRWEANEVSSRCGEAVELLAAELDRFAAAASVGRLAEAAPLAELLYDVWR